MHVTWVQALLIAIAAYLAMSVWPFGVGYFTLYRPLISGTIVGLILGDVQRGMAFGAALNAVHLGFISTGGTLPSDLVTAGYIGTALALVSGLDVGPALAAFGIPLGVLGGFIWFVRMTFGSVLVRWADLCAERGDARGVAAVNLWAGQALLLLMYALPTFVIVYYGQWSLERMVALIPVRFLSALSVVGGMLPAAGLGLLLHSLSKVRLFPYFILGFVSAAYLDLPILVIALLGGAVAWLAVGRVERPSFQSDAEPIAAARVPRRVLYGAWVRWLMFLHASYNYERLQGLGFAHAMEPVIEHLYRSTVDRTAALKRHLVFFNSEPQFGALVPAAVIAMEEQRAAGASISDEAINGVKSGLMGPLAGVGDSLIQGLVTPLLLSLGIGLAQQGNLSGPLLYAILISAVVIGSSLVFWTLGYRWGRSAASRILASGWVQVVIAAVSIVSLAVIGGLTPRLVQLSISASLSVGQAVVSVQKDVLDPILRGLLPLALTLSVWWLLARRASLLHVIGLLFAAGIDMSYLGLAGGDAPSLFSSAWLSFLLGGAVTLRMALLHLWLPFLATALGLVILLRRRRV